MRSPELVALEARQEELRVLLLLLLALIRETHALPDEGTVAETQHAVWDVDRAVSVSRRLTEQLPDPSAPATGTSKSTRDLPLSGVGGRTR